MLAGGAPASVRVGSGLEGGPWSTSGQLADPRRTERCELHPPALFTLEAVGGRDDLDRLDGQRAELDDPSIEEITAQDLGGEYPAVQYGPPNVDYTIDIVSRLGEAFTFDDLDVEEVAAGNATIKVVSPAMLYRMKRDTVRLRDRADAERLRQVFGFEE